MSIMDITSVPGFENFEVCDDINKNDELIDFINEQQPRAESKKEQNFFVSSDESDYEDTAWMYQDVTKYRDPKKIQVSSQKL